MFNDGGNRGTSLLQRVKRRVSEELSVPPSTAKERFRHELKYLISYEQKADLNVRRAPLLGLDKQDAPLTHEQFDRILAGDYGFLRDSEHQLCREFYVECMCNVLRPRVIVDYEREPWILDAGTVRVTFDMNVRAAVGGFDVFDATLPVLPVLEPGKLVMEVKFTEFLPQMVRDLLPGKAQELTSASKYVLCYDKASYLRGFGYWQEGWSVPSL